MTSARAAPGRRPGARTPGGSPQRVPVGGKAGGLPRRGRSSRPARRCSKNRFRHCETTSRPQRSRAAIWSLRIPSAAISTICALVTCQYGNVYDRASDSRTVRSSSVRSIQYGLYLGINVHSRDDRMPRTLPPRPDANTSPYLRNRALSDETLDSLSTLAQPAAEEKRSIRHPSRRQLPIRALSLPLRCWGHDSCCSRSGSSVPRTRAVAPKIRPCGGRGRSLCDRGQWKAGCGDLEIGRPSLWMSGGGEPRPSATAARP